MAYLSDLSPEQLAELDRLMRQPQRLVSMSPAFAAPFSRGETVVPRHHLWARRRPHTDDMFQMLDDLGISPPEAPSRTWVAPLNFTVTIDRACFGELDRISDEIMQKVREAFSYRPRHQQEFPRD